MILSIYALIHLAPEGVANDVLLGSLESFRVFQNHTPLPLQTPIRDDQSLVHPTIHAI